MMYAILAAWKISKPSHAKSQARIYKNGWTCNNSATTIPYDKLVNFNKGCGLRHAAQEKGE